jgi:transporter family protein
LDVTTGILFGIAASAGWGLSDFFVAGPVRRAGIIRTLLWNQITGMVLLAIVLMAFFGLPRLSFAAIGIAALTAIVGAIATLSFYKGMEIGNVSVITPISACWASVTVMMSIAFLGEKLTGLQGLGIALAIAGAAVTSLRMKDIHGAKMAELSKGAGYAAMAFLGWGLQFFFLDIVAKEAGWVATILLVKIFIVLLLAAFAATRKDTLAFPQGIYTPIALIAIFEVAGFLAYASGAASADNSIVAPISATHPVVTILLARAAFGEKLEPNQIAGIIAVIAGLMLIY